LEILNEVEKLVKAGFYPIEASNFNLWYIDNLKRRMMFVAPHWISSSLKIAN